jgi:hypothetical protein
MTRLPEVPRVPAVPARRSETQVAVDVALGIAGAVIGTGLTLGRAAVDLPLLHRRVVWRPGFVAARWQPASLLEDAARHGAARRTDLLHTAQALLDHWAPVIVERVVSRLDLTGLVIRHVDIDEVVRAVDLDAVAARLDLDAIVRRIDLDAAVAGVDLDAAVDGVDINAIAGRLDIDAVIDRIDLVAMVEEVIAAIDLPAIIRDSTGSMASETLRGARMTGISADDAISRTLDRHLFRRRRTPVESTDPR